MNSTLEKTINSCPGVASLILVTQFLAPNALADGGPYLTSLADANGNSAADIAVLYQIPGKQSYVAKILDGSTGEKISKINYGKKHLPILFWRARDANGNGIPELVLVAMNSATGFTRVMVRDAATGETVSNATINKQYVPQEVGIGYDIAGVSSPIAILGLKATRPRVQILDAAFGTNVIVEPYQAGQLPLMATLDSGAVAILTNSGNNKHRVVLKDLNSGLRINGFEFQQLESAIEMKRNSISGAEGLSILGQDLTGKIVVQTHEVPSGDVVGSLRFGHHTPLSLIILKDLNGNGANEIAVLSRTDGGVYQARVKDGQSGDSISYMTFDKKFPPTGFQQLQDVSGNGVSELVVVGQNVDGRIRVQMKDAMTGEQTGRFVVHWGIPPEVEPLPPTDPVVRNVTSTSATLSWADKSNNETGFQVGYCTGLISAGSDGRLACVPGFSPGTGFIQEAQVGANVTSYTFTGLSPDTEYSRFVRAYNAEGSSANTGVRFTTEGPVVAPATLRIVNDLSNVQAGTNNWNLWNGIIRVRIGPYVDVINAQCRSVTASDVWERLNLRDTVYDIEDGSIITPGYQNPTSILNYEDFDVSRFDGENYCVYIQAGWWDYVIPPFGGLAYWEIHDTSVSNCQGQAVYGNKWNTFYIYDHEADVFEIRASQYLPHYHWQGTGFCN